MNWNSEIKIYYIESMNYEKNMPSWAKREHLEYCEGGYNVNSHVKRKRIKITNIPGVSIFIAIDTCIKNIKVRRQKI